MSKRKPRNNTARRAPPKIRNCDLELADGQPETTPAVFEPFIPLPGVIPANREASTLAMDSTPYDVLNNMSIGTNYSGFAGYPVLATLSQRVEYANMHNVLADEMTRNWIEVKSHSENVELVKTMEAALRKFDIKRLIHDAVRQDSMFGVAHIYIDTGASEQENARALFLSDKKITKGSVKEFRLIEPTWVYPSQYNTSNPLVDGFYRPQQWFVMGKVVHASRFIDIVSRPVPDILKPSYNFGGLSLTQLMKDYVEDWLEAKKVVLDIMKTLRVRGLKTDMEARMEEPGEFDKRIKLFTKYQNNMGIWAVDLQEEFFHFQTSLSELSNLLSSYQEQLCIPARITTLKLLGNPPAGLNPSGDGEMSTWHETVSGMQERDIRRALETIFKVIQLSEFGAIQDDIYFDFKPLDELSEKDAAEITERRVGTVTKAADSMLVSSEEARQALKAIDGAGFEGLEGDYDGEEEPGEEGGEDA
jgi:phage-related protein (TIGR01555 family)